MIKLLFRLYRKVEFGLGIKPYFNKFFFWFGRTYFKSKGALEYWLDNHVFFYWFERLHRHLYGRIAQHYGADYRWGDERSQNIDSHTSSLGYGLLQYAMIRNQRPQTVLCVGSMYGFIPYMLAKACEDNRRGHVYFVDAGYDIAKPKNRKDHFFGQGFWRKSGALKHFDYLLHNPEQYLSLHVMTSEAFAGKYPRLAFDYIYLDGDHSYKGVKRDIGLFWGRLRKGGYLCLHDISYDRPDSKISIEMKKAWSEIVAKTGKNQVIEFTNNYSGLGFIKKTDDTPIF